jgi:hypothetical protein
MVRPVFTDRREESNELLPGRDPVRAGVPWCVLVSVRPTRMPSITIRMKEEQQIRVRVEFGVGRRRIRVERGRIRVGEFSRVPSIFIGTKEEQ